MGAATVWTATFQKRFRGEGSQGEYHTGYDEYTTFFDQLEIGGHVDYSDKELKNLNLTLATYKPVISDDWPYASKVGERFGGSTTFGPEDIKSSKFSGSKLVVDFLPGRSLKQLKLNTDTGELKLSKPGWFSRGWSMETYISRQ